MTANDSALSSRVDCIDSNCVYIEHYVSKLDTLAGLAIKYGVEVADVKRFNGLATDSQMYAHKMLKIPLYGKHPTKFFPSSSKFSFTRKFEPVDRYQISSRNKRSPSAAMELLRGYYGLPPSPQQAGNNEALLGLTACEDRSDVEPSSAFERHLLGKTNGSFMSNGMKIHKKSESSLAELSRAILQDSSEHMLSTNISTIGDVNNERSVRRRLKGEIVNLPAPTEVTGDQDVKSGESELKSVSMIYGHEIFLGSPVTTFSVLDEALAGIKNKEIALSKVGKSPSVPNLQDQASLQVNVAVQKFISMVEEKLPSSLTKNQAVLRGISDMLPKASYLFKTALD